MVSTAPWVAPSADPTPRTRPVPHPSHHTPEALGPVCLHLAENPHDTDRPFAFLATVASPRPAGPPRHIPFARALEQVRGHPHATDRILGPLHEAAKNSPWFGNLVDRGQLLHPQRWTATTALTFLRTGPILEAAGLHLRVPRWWTEARSNPRVRVVLHPREDATLDTRELLRLDVHIALGDTPLTPEEQARLLASHDTFVRLRGRWVEVDAARLQAVLDRWTEARAAIAGTGLSVVQALRVLAGTAPADDDTPPIGIPTNRWQEVVAGPALQDRLRALRSTPVPAAAPPGLRATLRTYQQTGLAWLTTLGTLGLGALLADDMGLGKTVQVLALLLRLHHAGRPASLVVVPTSLLRNWASEAARFTPDLTVAIAHPSAGATAWSPDQPADVVLTTYGMLHRLPHLLDPTWERVVFDEAQALKNPTTLRARTARRLTSRAVVLLTGTPIENRPLDLWALFDLANPGLLGTARRFTDTVQQLGDDRAPLRRLVAPYILRRTKSDPGVAPELPDKTEVTVWCGLGPAQATLYRDTVQRLRAVLDQADAPFVRGGAVLSTLTRLKQVCDHPALVTDTPNPRHTSGKLRELARLARTLADTHERMLVFTQFRRMMPLLEATLAEAYGRDGLTLHGGTPVSERARRVDAFQAPDGPPFFVLSLRAAGTGLNLTAARHVVHFDRWWNPAVENQATDRTHRIGQQHAVLVHKFTCRGTIEERIDRLLEDKAHLARDLLAPTAGPALTHLDDTALLDLVRLDLDSARLHEQV